MTVDERTRHELFLALEGVLGREEAVTLMEHLPPSGWEEVATKADIAAVAKDLERLATTQRGEFDVVRRESDVARGEVDLVRGEVSRLREDMDRRFEQVDRRFDEMNGRFDETNGRFDEERERVIAVVRESEQRVLATIRGEMVEAMGRQSRLMAFSLVGALTANTGLVLAALRLGT